MADYIGATPQVNPLMGLLAERLKQAQEFAVKPFGYSNPPAEAILNLLGIPAVQQTAERIAYGEPLTTGSGMTTQIRPEAIDAALTVAPAAGLLGRGVERGAMAAGRAGERYAEKVVPQIMERGGLPAQLLGDLSQGSVRPMDVWHGSPHGPFEKFDASKIGSGEGSQQYGYGLYLAQAPDEAKQYVAMAANPARRQYGLTPEGKEQQTIDALIMTNANQFTGGDVSKLSDLIDRKPAAFSYPEKMKSRISEYVNDKPPAFLYKVDLPDEQIANMLDFDKPIKEQNQIVRDLAKKYEVDETDLGGDLLSRIGKGKQGSEVMSQAGLSGIKFLDLKSLRGSRDAPAHNFVVFPGAEDALTIKEINDKPVGGLLGQSKAAFTYPQDEALKLAQQRAALPKEQFGLGLPPNNTAQQRADAMFPFDVYHGTNADIQVMNTAGKGKTSGAGAFVNDNPLAAETYVNAAGGGNIIPMRMSKEGLLDVNAKGRNWADIETNTLAPKAGKKRYSLDEMELQKNDVTSTDELGMIAKDLLGLQGVNIKNVKDLGPNSHIFRAKEYLQDKYGIVPDETWSNVTGNQFAEARDYMDNLYKSQKSTVTAVQNPDLLRSRFAAFDPFRRTAAIAAAMGVAAPDLLAEEQKPKKKKNLLD